MSNLKKFIKETERKPPRVTLSVNIEKDQQAWIRERCINLSKLVRAIIDKAMRGEDIDL